MCGRLIQSSGPVRYGIVEGRNRIELVLNWAIAREYRIGDNPARWRGHLDHLLLRPSKIADSDEAARV